MLGRAAQGPALSNRDAPDIKKSDMQNSSNIAFEDIYLKDFLEADNRPTFVLDSQAGPERIPIFINHALRNHTLLLPDIEAASKGFKHSSFRKWINRVDTHSGENKWRGYLWRTTPIRERWLLFQGTSSRDPDGGLTSPPAKLRADPFDTSQRPSIGNMGSFSSLDAVASPQEEDEDEEMPIIDWTRPSVPSPTPYVEFFKRFNWSVTPLGPIMSWPHQLRTICNTILADHEPGLVLWGPAMSMIYNNAAVDLIGGKHPEALGRHPTEVFGPLWPPMEEFIRATMRTGKVSKQQNIYLPMNRKGWIEESYWTFTLLPIIGPDGSALGIYDRFVESTTKVITERRMSTLVRVGDLTNSVENLSGLYKKLLGILESNELDVPFAAIYSVSNTDEPEQSSVSSDSTTSIASKMCTLEDHIGILPEQNLLPKELTLSDQGHIITEKLVQAWRANNPVLLHQKDGTLPSFLALQNPDRSFGDVCQSAVVFPIRFALEHMLSGYVIMGLNSRRPFDEDYDGYLKLLHRRMVDAVAAIVVPAEEVRNRAIQREESQRQASLTTTLLTRTHEAELKHSRFVRLAERAPIGMGLYDSNSNPIFFNDAYYEMTGIKRNTFEDYGWIDVIHEEDVEYVAQEWRKLAEHRMPVTLQHRVKKIWRSIDKATGTEISGDTWLLSSAFPELTGDGPDAAPALIMGWTIDISHQKWAENLQRQRLEDALENKRQSENFIDMTSHEMRNPLSAILQSADGISTIIATTLGNNKEPDQQQVLKSIAENAQTIILCAQHQKRIVDDILTLSKLDSNLLQITPDRVDPVALVNHVLKMYEAELNSHDIPYNLVIEEGYRKIKPGTVLIDPSRLLQVLINLLTNAIKFTLSQKNRKITLSLNASNSKPVVGPKGATFVPANKARRQPPITPLANSQDVPLYLIFAVHDTGRGLSDDERKVLFQRFSQASPRTHVQYGGSGLGLFISRELTEIQGGQIGVASELGKGSTFAFYVKCFRCEPADYDMDGVSEVVPMPFTSVPVLEESSESVVPVSELRAAEGTNVLVVEDNIINQKVMVNQLRGLGCTVHVANHGEEALKFLRTSSFANDTEDEMRLSLDVILMDVEMPVMDGLTCVRKIREMQEEGELNRHVPVICITANAREAQVAEAKAHGCDLVVTKPFRIPELIPQMKRLVDSYR